MTGGIDWFRWHHGSVTDPKFQLVARKAGASLSDVLAVWAYLLEAASASTVRGQFGDIDTEAIDCLFNFPSTETRTANIVDAMRDRRLLDGHCICSWEKRQPKREDETANDRKRRQREREHEMQKLSVTQAMSRSVTQGHARGEERREEEIQIPPTLRVAPPLPAKRKPKTAMPADFCVSKRVADWAAEKGFDLLSEHLDAFRRKVAANGYTAVSWDDKFMEAIR